VIISHNFNHNRLICKRSILVLIIVHSGVSKIIEHTAFDPFIETEEHKMLFGERNTITNKGQTTDIEPMPFVNGS
jgi:hypothetical protein